MALDEFIDKLCVLYNLPNKPVSTTVLSEAEWWDSMALIELITFVDEEYGKVIDSDDFASMVTLADLYDLVVAN